MWILRFRIHDELENLKQQQFESTIPFSATDDWRQKEEARQAAIRKQWDTLYDELTHSKNTALFAFIRYNRDTKELIECDVQNVLWYSIMCMPPLFLGFWGYVIIKDAAIDSRMRHGRGVIWWPLIGLASGSIFLLWWVRFIQNDYYAQITRSLREIAMLANGLSYGQ
jgi:hypothetical protein